MHRSAWYRRGVRVTAVAAAVVLLLAGCGKKSSTTALKLRAGGNDPNDRSIAILAFLPSSMTVKVGATVTWTVTGPEPHTVTFVPAGSPPPSPSDPNASKAVGPTGTFDPAQKISSGFLGLPGGPDSFKLKFATAGNYTYYCHIHPTMIGKLTVTTGDGEAEKTIVDNGKAELARYIKEGRAAKQKLLASVATPKTNKDGSKTWTVEMGAGTAHTAILSFAPVPANIKKGDKVVFVNNSGEPHTASFAGKTTLPQVPESPAAMRPTGKSPLTLNATAFLNTGWLPPDAPPGSVPLAARTFTFNVPTAGTFAYVCLLHQGSGMTGTIVAS